MGHGKCAIQRIPYGCLSCTNMLDKDWVPGMYNPKKLCYQPVPDWTYWYVLGTFNNCNIIKIWNKNTPSEDFDEVHKVVIDEIGANMESLIHNGKYGAIHAADNTTLGCYIVTYFSYA